MASTSGQCAQSNNLKVSRGNGRSSPEGSVRNAEFWLFDQSGTPRSDETSRPQTMQVLARLDGNVGLAKSTMLENAAETG